jgi:HSP20 family protein
MVTIRGRREEYREAGTDEYYHRELFWGSFSRTLLLPEEVVIDEADAQEKHGLLEIRLPKVDKGRSAKLRVKPHFQQK